MTKPPSPPDPQTLAMRADARAIFNAGIRAVDPHAAVMRHCRREDNWLRVGEHSFDLGRFKNLWVVGAGKATAAMAQAVEQLLGPRISGGLISVKYGHTLPLSHIRTVEAGHPLPDDAGMTAAQQVLTIVKDAGSEDLVLVLISGGGSALLPLPVPGITLQDKQTVTQTLLDCGATIAEINAVRKHLSAIKGGQLAQAGRHCTMVCLMLSDVVGDDPQSIASGPTVADPSTYADCMEMIDRYAIAAEIPQSVTAHLSDGVAGLRPETPKAATHVWKHVTHHIIANNLQALQAAAAQAERLGYRSLILSSRIEGETRIVAGLHAAIAREVLESGHPLPAPACLLSGGETTVTLRGSGLGGRNQEFALASALAIAEVARTVVLSAGSDGGDGPTPAAGAIVDHFTFRGAAARGLDPRAYLDNNDSYTFFKHSGDLLITGPTRTNVMDLRIVLIRGAGNLQPNPAGG